ncbi:MAG: hypothetical protein K0U12_02270, partial [Gammaproteobacteria bacterium]|nr:hypothetical protein [Gammaproteobacteria bacterium]
MLLASVSLASARPLCIAHLKHPPYLYAAFIYPDTSRLNDYDMRRLDGAFKHLDVLVYSVGLVDHAHRLHLSIAARHNLRLIHRWLIKHHEHTHLMLAIAGWGSESKAAPVFRSSSMRQRFLASVATYG